MSQHSYEYLIVLTLWGLFGGTDGGFIKKRIKGPKRFLRLGLGPVVGIALISCINNYVNGSISIVRQICMCICLCVCV